MHRHGDGEEWNYLTPEPRPPKTPKHKLADAKRKLTQGRRPRVLHFRWKKSRLSLCLGGLVIAAWPASDEDCIRHLVETKVIKDHWDILSQDQRKVRGMALRLRAALVKAEDGPRAKSAHRQRVRVDQLFKLGMYR
jgi:hypothetical protein